MLPIAGGLQRLAERVGRGRASRFAMLGEPIPGSLAGQLGIATHVVREAELAQAVEALAQKLAVGPTKSYTATRTLLKAWSAGGVPAADSVLLDISMDLFNTEDDTRGFLNTAEAIDRDVEPLDLVFNNRRSAPGRPRCSSGPGRITPHSEIGAALQIQPGGKAPAAVAFEWIVVDAKQSKRTTESPNRNTDFALSSARKAGYR